MRFKLDRQFYIPKDATVIYDQPGAIVYGYNLNGKVIGLAFKGKAQKPTWHSQFNSTQSRQEYIDRWLHFQDLQAESKRQYKHERQREISEANIRPGDYFYTSWGYDQTNIDYLVVVRTTAKTAICKMVEPIHVGESGQQDVLMPGTAYGDTFRMQISGRDSLTGSYPYCGGSTRLGHFSRTNLAQTRNQTMPIYGH